MSLVTQTSLPTMRDLPPLSLGHQRLLGCNWRNSAPSGFCLLALCRKIETFACGSNYSVVDLFVIYAIRRTAPKMTSDRILGWYLTELINYDPYDLQSG